MNGTPLFYELFADPPMPTWGEADEAGVHNVIDLLAEAADSVAAAKPTGSHADAIVDEIGAAVRLARHGAWRIARNAGFEAPADSALRTDLAEAIERQRSAWLARSRPGGLSDSLARFEATLADYDA